MQAAGWIKLPQRFWGPPASYPTYAGVYSLGSTANGTCSSGAKVKDQWSYTSILSICLHGVHFTKITPCTITNCTNNPAISLPPLEVYNIWNRYDSRSPPTTPNRSFAPRELINRRREVKGPHPSVTKTISISPIGTRAGKTS